MFGLGISFMAVGALSFILPLMGRQFVLVALLGMSGAGSTVTGLVLFGVGFFLFNRGRAKIEASSNPVTFSSNAHIDLTPQPPTTELIEQQKENNSIISQEAFEDIVDAEHVYFLFAKQSLFEGSAYMPKDLGIELPIVSYRLACEQASTYIKRIKQKFPDSKYSEWASDGEWIFIMILTCRNAAAVLCFIRRLLKADDLTLETVRRWFNISAEATFEDVWSDSLNFSKLTLLLDKAIENEISELEENSSGLALITAITEIYKNDTGQEITHEEFLDFAQDINGHATRLMAIYQNDFELMMIPRV
jgi:hypothetical protein